MAESSFMSNSNSPSKDCHSPNVSMLGEVEMVEQGGEEGAEGGSSDVLQPYARTASVIV